MQKSISIVWFYNDLRLGDHAALTTAAARGPIVPLFILDEAVPLGAASRWALAEALRALATDLKVKGVDLILRRGNALTALRAVIAESGATQVHWSRRYEPALAARDAAIEQALHADGITCTAHSGFLLADPTAIKTTTGSFFKVFTPFAKACFATLAPARPLPAPTKLNGITGLTSDSLAAWTLVPTTSHWPTGLTDAWAINENTAHDLLRDFLDTKLAAYKTMRDQPAQDGTSRLSPYLHFGLLSPRQIWHAAASQPLAEKFLQEILWREFAWHLLVNIPDFAREPWQKSFAAFPWRIDAPALAAWQRGLTGYPIVDAGMRQLWQTGWMHNRVRMIAASFLIKDLLIDWRTGAAWFDDCLIDADLGSNTASWQWVAGCGADAAPYFRIFNPTLQGQKFDPDGTYVRRFVPELARLEAKYIHAPWTAPAATLAQAGITLGATYPAPIVDHGTARQRALAALKDGKQAAQSGDLFD